MTRYCSLALAALLCAFAGTAWSATIVVDVRDRQGAPLADAVVSASTNAKESPASGERVAIMDQKGRTFVPHVLPIQAGTAVKFPNSDDIQHSVYSFSPAKTFQLPLYKGTPANRIVFATPGVVSLGCNIHDKMSGYIVVLDTPVFEKTEVAGRVELRNLEPGKYTLHIWHPDMKEEPATQTILLGEGETAHVAFIVNAVPAPVTATPLTRTEDKFKKYGNDRP